MKISVIIPVFNSPKYLDRLLNSIRLNTNFDLVTQIILGDDASDSFTSELLNLKSKEIPNCSVITRNKNLGYLQNINQLYNLSTNEITILVNSDVILPPLWAERVCDAFNSYSNIGLACPLTTNATNLTLHPALGQSWLDIDTYFRTSGYTATYPDCFPVVGFFLAISKKAFPVPCQLLDPIYQDGYWEDTDLHFRSIQKGFRNVIIDNLFVYHSIHSPSFSLNHDLKEVNDTNKKIFLSKWESQYKKALTQPTKYKGQSFEYTFQRKLNILFCLPSLDQMSGGIDVVMSLIDELTLLGYSAACYVTQPHFDINNAHINYLTVPFNSLSTIEREISSIDYVFYSLFFDFKHAKIIAEKYNAELCCLVQGPETAFVQGKFVLNCIKAYSESDKIIVVSSYLQKVLTNLGIEVDYKINLGPSCISFYNSDTIKREPKSLAACVVSKDLKGVGILLSNIYIAHQAGYKVYLFGDTHTLSPDVLSLSNVQDLGQLSKKDIFKLLNKTEFFLSTSYLEGLGLPPLEASFCGCVPILTKLNGLDGILIPGVSCILAEEFTSINFWKNLQIQKNKLKNFGQNARNTVSIEKAAQELCQYLQLSKKDNKAFQVIQSDHFTFTSKQIFLKDKIARVLSDFPIMSVLSKVNSGI